MPRKNLFVVQMVLAMTSFGLCGASMLPPPLPGIGLGAVAPVTAPAAAPVAAPRSDDPFLAFLRTAGVDPSQEVHLPEADSEAAGGDRVKRTGGVLGPLIGQKLSYLTKGSNHVHFHNYGTGNKGCDKWSLWDFKKAILGKLLEAAKAIGGGVLALKGKLLTFKGHLVEVKGRKLAEKGEALSEFGKGVIAKVLGHGTTGHASLSAPSAPSGPAAALSIAPSGYGHHLPAHPPQPQPQYGVPTGHGGGHGHTSGAGYDAATSLLDEFNVHGFDRNSEHRRGTIHAGLLVLQPLKRQVNPAFSPRSTAPGAPSAPDMMSSASETSEEHVLQPLRVSLSHTPPLVLAPEVIDTLTTEVGVPSESASGQPQVGQPQGSPSENTEQWVAPPDNLPTHTQAVLPNRLLSANLQGHSGTLPQSAEAAMAKVIAKLHGQSSHFPGVTSTRRR